MKISINTLLDYVFDDLPNTQQEVLEEAIKNEAFYQDTVASLLQMKENLKDKEKIKKLLLEKKQKLNKRWLTEGE